MEEEEKKNYRQSMDAEAARHSRPRGITFENRITTEAPTDQDAPLSLSSLFSFFFSGFSQPSVVDLPEVELIHPEQKSGRLIIIISFFVARA